MPTGKPADLLFRTACSILRNDDDDVLGGQQLECDACGHSHWQYHSCRNRHCPQCGARAKDAWRQGTPAFSLVLHTWTQDLQRHIHLHAVMACGVL